MTEECTLHIRGEQTGEGAWGEPVFSDPQAVDYRCWVEPVSSSEGEPLTNTQLSQYDFSLPESAPVRAVDSISWRGLTFGVEGEPRIHPGGFLFDPMIVLRGRMVTG